MKFALAICAVLLTSFQTPLLADKFDEYRFRFNLSATAVTPRPAATAEGAGWIYLYTRTSNEGRLVSAYWRVGVGVDTNETRPAWSPVRLIEAPLGQTGPIVVEFPLRLDTIPFWTTGTMPPDAVSLVATEPQAVPNLAMLPRLIANPSAFHFRVATSANPNGLAMGALRAVRQIYAGCSLKPSNVVPPSDVDGAAEFSILARDHGDYIEFRKPPRGELCRRSERRVPVVSSLRRSRPQRPGPSESVAPRARPIW
ncbi:MAG: CHRD domain-containing protein [Bryobacteraceae bacterium]